MWGADSARLNCKGQQGSLALPQTGGSQTAEECMLQPLCTLAKRLRVQKSGKQMDMRHPFCYNE